MYFLIEICYNKKKKMNSRLGGGGVLNEDINVNNLEQKKKRVKRLKRAIIITIIILCLLPTILCIILGIKLIKLEKKIEDLLLIYPINTEAEGPRKGRDQYAYASTIDMADEVIDIGDDYISGNTEDMDEADVAGEAKETDEADIIRGTGDTVEADVTEGTDNPDEADLAENDNNPDEIDFTEDIGDIDLSHISDRLNSDSTYNESEPTVEYYRDPDGIYYDKKVYLTFDDGPSNNTDKILDILAEYNVKATFFVVGYDDTVSKERYKRIVNEGHSLGIHSYSHNYNKIYKSLEDFDKDFTKLWKLLYDTTGYTPTLYRFPGGSKNFVKRSKMEEFIRYLNEKGMTYYDWNVVNGDAEGKNYTEEQMIDNVLNGVASKKNSIVLMHDGYGKEKTVAGLPKILEALISGGAEVLPMDENAPLIQQIKATSVK